MAKRRGAGFRELFEQDYARVSEAVKRIGRVPSK
jgi:hypothetical protein